MNGKTTLEPIDAFPEAIRRLAGRQIVDFHDAYTLLGGKGDPDLMSDRKGLCDLLHLFGYREKWVAADDDEDAGFRWIRDPWPVDERVLSVSPSVAYRSMTG